MMWQGAYCFGCGTITTGRQVCHCYPILLRPFVGAWRWFEYIRQNPHLVRRALAGIFTSWDSKLITIGTTWEGSLNRKSRLTTVYVD